LGSLTTGLIDKHLYDKGPKLSLSNRDPAGKNATQIRTITYDDETASWSKNNHLIEIGALQTIRVSGHFSGQELR
jgi:hypothetical protein